MKWYKSIKDTHIGYDGADIYHSDTVAPIPDDRYTTGLRGPADEGLVCASDLSAGARAVH